MYYTAVDICNMALAQLKVRPIGSLDESTEEARQCHHMYPYALSQVLTMANWNFCRTKRRLARIDPEAIDRGFIVDEKMNYFKYPIDAIKLLHVSLHNELFPPRIHPHGKLREIPSKETNELYHHYQPDYLGHPHDCKSLYINAEDEEEETEDIEDTEEETEDTHKKHHHHHRPRHHGGPTPMLPIFPRVLPPPRNDDGYDLQSIKLLHQHVFIEVIVTPYSRVDVEYIRYVDNPQFWPPMFTEVVVRYLALQLATLLSGKSDSIEIQSQAFQMALIRATAVNGNDRKKTLHQKSRLLRGCY